MEKLYHQDNLEPGAVNKDFENAVSRAIGDSFLFPSARLSQKIIETIVRKRRQQSLIKFCSYTIATIISFVIFVFVWRAEKESILSSQAGKLLSLLFSDWRVVLSLWKEYLLSIFEALPIASIVLLSLFLWIAFASLWAAIKNYFIFINSAVNKHV